MRTLIIGAGATGGYYGGRMAQAGRDVTFLVRGKRAEQLQRDGLHIRSVQGDADLQPKLISAQDLHAASPFDLVLVTTKAYGLDDAMRDFAPAVDNNTLILPVLNGMSHLARLQERFGVDRVLCGTCRIIADINDDGHVVQTGKLDDITCAAAPGSSLTHERVAAVHAELNVPNVVAIHAADGIAAMWDKWWFLASFGAVCVLGGGSLGQVAAQPFGAETALAVVEETRRVAEANGHSIAPASLDFHRKRVTSVDADITSSLYRDMLRGHAVEADAILGDMIRLAKDVPVPLLKAAYARLKVYEASRAQQSG